MHRRDKGLGLGVGSLYGEVQCIMVIGYMRLRIADKMTHMTENITFPQLNWQSVTTFIELIQEKNQTFCSKIFSILNDYTLKLYEQLT